MTVKVMQKIFLSAFLSLAMTVVIAKATDSRPVPQGMQFPPENIQLPEQAKANTDLPVCYLQTEDGRTLNLSRLCQTTPVISASRSTYPEPPKVYNYVAMKAFDEQLYGPAR